MFMMHTRAVWKELPDGNPRAARKSRERDLNSAHASREALADTTTEKKIIEQIRYVVMTPASFTPLFECIIQHESDEHGLFFMKLSYGDVSILYRSSEKRLK